MKSFYRSFTFFLCLFGASFFVAQSASADCYAGSCVAYAIIDNGTGKVMSNFNLGSKDEARREIKKIQNAGFCSKDLGCSSYITVNGCVIVTYSDKLKISELDATAFFVNKAEQIVLSNCNNKVQNAILAAKSSDRRVSARRQLADASCRLVETVCSERVF